ncbi:MAG TPA: hypothetical protein VMT85_21605 [Thermoanaerobaculia bacterium]|nr:hypothetical protein [Thermoanaerobaculia bacterium]
MSRRISAVLGFLALAAAGVAPLGACGDKFLVGTLGGRYLSYAGKIHPTRILVYWQEDLDNPRGEGDSILETSLTEAGHSVVIAKDSKSLYQSAASGGFEVIMMNVGEAREEQGRLQGVAPDSTILPVLDFPTRRELSDAKKEFGHAVKTPTTLFNLLSQIEKTRSSSR